MKKVASLLGIPYFTLADWRYQTRDQITGQPKKGLSHTQQGIRIRELERENAELRTANEILKRRFVFFRKRSEEVKTSERHIFIRERKNKYTFKKMC